MTRTRALYAAVATFLTPLFTMILGGIGEILFRFPYEDGHMSGIAAVFVFAVMILSLLPSFVMSVWAAIFGAGRIVRWPWAAAAALHGFMAIWWLVQLEGLEWGTLAWGIGMLILIHVGLATLHAWAIAPSFQNWPNRL